ncbi:MAG: hypothetical protein U9Q82_03560 [Chloroflexota bacterium]|nr:hypothetical protein [Chloroflexota bacterium]
MKVYPRTSVSEFLNDFIVYRNLTPLDKRIPSLDDVRARADVPVGITPRKSQDAYARVIVQLLQAARVLDAPDDAIERLIYIGDTRLNDGTAFVNIARAGDWPGLAFIASEKSQPLPPEIIEKDTPSACSLYLANTWAAIDNFEQFCRERNFPIDEHTAIIVDIDKTTIGARGRNDHVINQVRVEAVRRTVEHLLGADFDADAFQVNYAELNQTEFHHFTTDNQDYLAYVCLILGSGLYSLGLLVESIRTGQIGSFEQFIASVDDAADQLPPSLGDIHRSIYTRVQAGDPTPFKAFRRNEYLATIERMGCLDDDASVDDLLANEIVITQEVREAALRWKAAGALLFGLSDKPDEASLPTDELAAQGYQSIHRVETHALGGISD